ncbi:1-aminocyclopropane-1-carboxylate deaminase/D-cysteine desulfhydrase [Rheinheimera sp. MM224]|uniref:1-aminocyclopropane-1-carboxylate deaminase/D-cysteine desulfhydrase n=1 Tax=Rheinheimera sp. MM224 TaxID=3019969 RepID=UPI0021F88841|nr:pyridoxal-phosphate dependent enzyme [Rheinheimera sp. MM224]CAI3805249.1 D-cysteine desulfhydrase [Rheinheimera sp. MM224]
MKLTSYLQWKKLQHPVLTGHQTELWLRYAPSDNPDISGNKLLKLKYQLELALQQKYQGLLTFGGAFSNHLVATAAAAAENNLKSIGIVRGEDADLNNPTLALCQSYGMQLIRVSRADYQSRHLPETIQQLSAQFPAYLHIPEGGTCEAAVRGVSELDMCNTPNGPASLLICAVGSGGTIAGLIHGAESTAVLGIAVVKDLSLPEKIKQFLPLDRSWPEWQLIQALHQPRYGRFDQELWRFCQSFADQEVWLEPIYTGKALYSVFELIKSGVIPKGSRLSFFHTGGLQALKGLAYRGLINPITDSEQ